MSLFPPSFHEERELKRNFDDSLERGEGNEHERGGHPPQEDVVQSTLSLESALVRPFPLPLSPSLLFLSLTCSLQFKLKILFISLRPSPARSALARVPIALAHRVRDYGWGPGGFGC